MKNMLRSIRFWVLTGSILLSVALYLWIIVTTAQGNAQMAKLVEVYGLLALAYLYFTLLAGPFCFTFRSFPLRGQYMHARRSLGVSVFYFALLHSLFSLFGQLGGFAGLGFLSNNYLEAVILGFVALFILSLLTITSFDWAVAKLSFRKWKLLHRLVYFAGIFILVHTVMLGTHYSDLSGIVSQVTFIALAFLLFLEAPRFDQFFRKFIPVPSFGVSFTLIAIIMGTVYFSFLHPLFGLSNGIISFDIHAAHRQLAQQALQQTQAGLSGNSFSNIPGLSGDRTKRYTVSMTTDPPNPKSNGDVTIRFSIYDASSGNRSTLFRTLFDKPMHLMIVNSDLTYFHHIHPTFDNQDFVITTQFPQDDLYHLYISFQPFEAIEQQVGFTLPVGGQNKVIFSNAQPDSDHGKSFGDYTVAVDTHGGLRAKAMSEGNQIITFNIKDAKTGKLITNLKPYLSAFGHLTMINKDTFDFIHVHPYNLTPPPLDANGGPSVDFLPIGIYGPFKPGIYRAFAEFNPAGHLFTADFTVKIE